MKIAIINLTAGGMSEGYKKYLRNVIPRMAKHSDVEAILCATPLSINIHNWLEPLPNIKFVNCIPFSPLSNGSDTELHEYLNKFSPDMIFVPTERSFSFHRTPVVNMIQNMEPLVYPYKGCSLSEKIRNWLRIREAKKAICKADRVIAVSRFVRDFLIEQWDISDDRIVNIYHGVNPSRENSKVERPQSIPQNWDGRFLFTAGSIRPARGLEDAIPAMKHLVSNKADISGLVIAGGTDSSMTIYRKHLERKIKSYKISNRICWVGNLNEQEMTWCYKNCLMFLMTSRVESFGMTAGEAMSHGCICISSNSPCLPEIFGDAAMYYPAGKGDALAELIKDALSWGFPRRKAVSEKAKKRALKFSWDVCADNTVSELAKAVEIYQSNN